MRKADKVPLKYHKSNVNSRNNYLEFDKKYGLLLLSEPKKVHIFSELNFNNPLEINRPSIKIAKFVPSEASIAIIEQKNKFDDNHQINFYGLYANENEEISVKQLQNLILPNKEDVKDVVFRHDSNQGNFNCSLELFNLYLYRQ
jgi:hypothetical protein